jgi:phosphoribosylanthranilate isomerase
MNDYPYTKTELLICVAARLFQDGTTAFIGTGIPMLAAMLATKTVAPSLVPVFEFGGTGATAPWEMLAREYKAENWPPLILAGGLRPDNVAEAIRAVNPWGVDVAGGVESAVACKDATLVRQFVQNAKGML